MVNARHFHSIIRLDGKLPNWMQRQTIKYSLSGSTVHAVECKMKRMFNDLEIWNALLTIEIVLKK